jgi:dUTP pyrophosphatase
MKVQIQRVRPNTPIPVYQHSGDAGMDLVNMGPEIDLAPMSRTLIPTGIRVAIPEGYEIQIRPRSGMALKKGLTLLNTPGTIDAGYRGEIGVIMFNSNLNETIKILPLERIAQAVLKRFEEIEWIESEDLDASTRGEGGFGSTGTK